MNQIIKQIKEYASKELTDASFGGQGRPGAVGAAGDVVSVGPPAPVGASGGVVEAVQAVGAGVPSGFLGRGREDREDGKKILGRQVVIVRPERDQSFSCLLKPRGLAGVLSVCPMHKGPLYAQKALLKFLLLDS